jgi:hypothetical protein
MGAGELRRQPQRQYSVAPTSLAIELGIPQSILDQVPNYTYADVLYPKQAICIYFVIRTGKAFIPDPERQCNDYLERFIAERVATLGIETFFRQFKSAITDKVFELIALRILAATYQYGKNKMDYLPEYRRDEICKYLHIPLDISCNDAITKLEQVSRMATDEEQILGRLGYLMSWKVLAGKNYNPTIVDDDKIEILTNVPKDNRGLPLDRSILKEWGREDTEGDVMEGPVPGVDY